MEKQKTGNRETVSAPLKVSQRIREWLKPKIKFLIILLGGIALVAILLLPFIVEKVYYIKPPLEFFSIHYDVADILGYYASVLSFAGTIILGILTLHQNKKAQEHIG